MKKLILILSVVFYTTLAFSQEFGTFTDPRDGKTYKTSVVLGNTWLAENLAYKVDDEGCSLLTDSLTVGYAYTWEVAKDVCPQGWRLPTKDEIVEILNYYAISRLFKGNISGLELDHSYYKSGERFRIFYWTGTAGYNQLAWNYTLGGRRQGLATGYKSHKNFVRCIKK